MNDAFESALFEPAVILPSQISVDARWAAGASGPIALMLAVLEEAARCLERGRRNRHPGIRTLAAETATWCAATIASSETGWRDALVREARGSRATGSTIHDVRSYLATAWLVLPTVNPNCWAQPDQPKPGFAHQCGASLGAAETGCSLLGRSLLGQKAQGP